MTFKIDVIFLVAYLHAICPVFLWCHLTENRVFSKGQHTASASQTCSERYWLKGCGLRDLQIAAEEWWTMSGREATANAKAGIFIGALYHLCLRITQGAGTNWWALILFCWISFPHSFVRLFSNGWPHLEFKLCKGWDIELKWKENVSHLFSLFRWTQKKYIFSSKQNKPSAGVIGAWITLPHSLYSSLLLSIFQLL